jgi:hypothetical protein
LMHWLLPWLTGYWIWRVSGLILTGGQHEDEFEEGYL